MVKPRRGFCVAVVVDIVSTTTLHQARPADQPHADRQGPGGGQLFGNVDPALTGSAFNHEGSIVFWTFQPSSACSFIQTWHHMLALIEKKP
jgi:hypothetical protein